MNTYKNTKTGALIETPCIIYGDDWEIIRGTLTKDDLVTAESTNHEVSDTTAELEVELTKKKQE